MTLTETKAYGEVVWDNDGFVFVTWDGVDTYTWFVCTARNLGEWVITHSEKSPVAKSLAEAKMIASHIAGDE